MIRAISLKNGFSEVATDFTAINAAIEGRSKLLWIDIFAENHELKNEEISVLFDSFKFHELSIEDCLFPQYQPKVEEFEEYVFVAVHGIKTKDCDCSDIENKIFELDIFLGKDYIVTVHTEPIPQIDLLFEKAKLKPQVELKSIDYLLYTMFDKIYNSYEFIVEKFNEKINTIEDAVLENPSRERMTEIFSFKKQLLSLKKVLEPQLNVYTYFTRESNGFISKKYSAYFRDMLSNYKRASQAIDSSNQIMGSLLEIYVSNVTLKLNEIIKFLTVIATIFLPALLITSYFGMNVPFFERALFGEENTWFFAFGIIILSTALTYIFIKRKKWF